MSKHRNSKTETGDVDRQQQPPELQAFLKGVTAAQRMLSMYGADHPNTRNTIGDMARSLDEFVRSFGHPTCVFAKDYLVVNEQAFSPTSDSTEISQRLRARGVMAVTLVGEHSSEQVGEFLAFLSAEPQEIMRDGGPRT